VCGGFVSGRAALHDCTDAVCCRLVSGPRKPKRRVAKAPFKVLDAPSLQDDFYLNLVDWSAQNVLAVGLGSSVYLWSALNSKVTRLVDVGPDITVTSVAWSVRVRDLLGLHLGAISADVAAVLRPWHRVPTSASGPARAAWTCMTSRNVRKYGRLTGTRIVLAYKIGRQIYWQRVDGTFRVWWAGRWHTDLRCDVIGCMGAYHVCFGVCPRNQ
jgi:hypothetical protein